MAAVRYQQSLPTLCLVLLFALEWQAWLRCLTAQSKCTNKLILICITPLLLVSPMSIGLCCYCLCCLYCFLALWLVVSTACAPVPWWPGNPLWPWNHLSKASLPSCHNTRQRQERLNLYMQGTLTECMQNKCMSSLCSLCQWAHWIRNPTLTGALPLYFFSSVAYFFYGLLHGLLPLLLVASLSCCPYGQLLPLCMQWLIAPVVCCCCPCNLLLL